VKWFFGTTSSILKPIIYGLISDWYIRNNAWQHTEEEAGRLVEDLELRTIVFNPANPNGISVLLTKRPKALPELNFRDTGHAMKDARLVVIFFA